MALAVGSILQLTSKYTIYLFYSVTVQGSDSACDEIQSFWGPYLSYNAQKSNPINEQAMKRSTNTEMLTEHSH